MGLDQASVARLPTSEAIMKLSNVRTACTTTAPRSVTGDIWEFRSRSAFDGFERPPADGIPQPDSNRIRAHDVLPSAFALLVG